MLQFKSARNANGRPPNSKHQISRYPRAALVAAAVESLEERRLLSGVTLITHGYEPLSNDRPDWLDDMKNAILTRVGSDTSVYVLRINQNSGNAYVQSFQLLAGPGIGATTGAHSDAVIMLDWAAASNVLANIVSAATIAQLTVPYFTNAALAGTAVPLDQLPVHLIGHSRGASVITALAGDLGQAGVLVDQVTMLDPVPVPPDPATFLYTNVVFSDNYYQTTGSLIDLFTHGSSVAGSHNVNITSTVTGHDEVISYYDGTIDLTTSDNVAGYPISNSMYSKPGTGPRDQIGYYFTTLPDYQRPSDGLSSAFGGTAARVTVVRSGPQSPNIATIQMTTAPSLPAGSTISINYRALDSDSAAATWWYLDPDTNPYNSNGILIGQPQNYGGVAAAQSLTFTASLAGVPAGTYNIVGRTSDGLTTRFGFGTQTLTIVGSDPALAVPFVTHVYQDLLGRDPDPDGLNYWSQGIINGTQTQNSVAHSLINSEEYRTILITDLYQASLGRAPDAAGLSSWLSFFAAGGTLEEMTAEFYGSEEYFIAQGSSNVNLVDSYYVAFLNRHADPNGSTYWVSQLESGVSRSVVARSIQTSSIEGAQGIVTDAYLQFLHRAPDPPGFSYWTGQIQAGHSQLEIEESFIASDEYYHRA